MILPAPTHKPTQSPDYYRLLSCKFPKVDVLRACVGSYYVATSALLVVWSLHTVHICGDHKQWIIYTVKLLYPTPLDILRRDGKFVGKMGAKCTTWREWFDFHAVVRRTVYNGRKVFIDFFVHVDWEVFDWLGWFVAPDRETLEGGHARQWSPNVATVVEWDGLG